MDNDNGLRDVVRSFVLHLWGEFINERSKEVFEEGGTINFEGRIVHSKEELIEAMVDYHFEEGRLAEAFKKFHEKHGFYPPLPDLSKLPRIGRLEGLEEKKLNISSLEAPVLQLHENDLGACLDEVSKAWREAFQRAGIELEAKFDPSIPTFRFDYQKVQQAAANLLDNALTHTPSGGSVTLNCMPRPDGVEVSVSGALEHDQKILDGYSTVPLFPGHTIEESRAVGLAIAKHLILAHHGKIWVEASSTGSRYMFLMPTDKG